MDKNVCICACGFVKLPAIPCIPLFLSSLHYPTTSTAIIHVTPQALLFVGMLILIKINVMCYVILSHTNVHNYICMYVNNIYVYTIHALTFRATVAAVGLTLFCGCGYVLAALSCL